MYQGAGTCSGQKKKKKDMGPKQEIVNLGSARQMLLLTHTGKTKRAKVEGKKGARENARIKANVRDVNWSVQGLRDERGARDLSARLRKRATGEKVLEIATAVHLETSRVCKSLLFYFQFVQKAFFGFVWTVFEVFYSLCMRADCFIKWSKNGSKHKCDRTLRKPSHCS